MCTTISSDLFTEHCSSSPEQEATQMTVGIGQFAKVAALSIYGTAQSSLIYAFSNCHRASAASGAVRCTDCSGPSYACPCWTSGENRTSARRYFCPYQLLKMHQPTMFLGLAINVQDFAHFLSLKAHTFGYYWDRSNRSHSRAHAKTFQLQNLRTWTRSISLSHF